MKHYLRCLLLLSSSRLLNNAPFDCTNAITYELRQSRFGDHVILYCNAKLLSYKYKLPLLFKLFEYSDKLVMSRYEKSYLEFFSYFNDEFKIHRETQLLKTLYDQTKTIYSLNKVNFQSKEIEKKIKKEKVHRFLEPIYIFDDLYANIVRNSDLRKELKNMIGPIIPVSTIDLPKDQISVAVHVRKGGGYDLIRRPKPANKKFPLKFPPDEYYIKQIEKLSNMLEGFPMYIYIFTDDQKPLSVVRTFKKKLNNPSMTFLCRQTDNRHDLNVLEDFFSMAKFDCLIRPDSRFSQAAQIIGDHSIIIYPKGITVNDGDQIIKAGIIKNRNIADILLRYS